MKRGVLACLIWAACARPDPLVALQQQAAAIADANQVRLAVLVGRIAVLKQRLRGNLAGWEDNLRQAELACDDLGLPPFVQVVPSTSAWRPSPASLLGIAPYVRTRAAQLVSRGDLASLRFLVTDEQRRYDAGVVKVDGELARIERWLDQR